MSPFPAPPFLFSLRIGTLGDARATLFYGVIN